MKRKTVCRAACLAALAFAMLFTASCGLLSHRTEEEPAVETRRPAKATKKPKNTPVPAETYPPVEMVDAEEYFRENSEILDIVPLEESDSMLTEARAYALLRERGFTDYAITSDLNADGDFIDTAEISETSEEKHPTYEVYYTSSSGMLWIISVIGETVTANPFQYNLGSAKDAATILIETDYVTSYDNATKRFFDTVPSESALITIKVDRIDSAALDAMSAEELDK